jgi:hypothetical protein
MVWLKGIGLMLITLIWLKIYKKTIYHNDVQILLNKVCTKDYANEY